MLACLQSLNGQFVVTHSKSQGCHNITQLLDVKPLRFKFPKKRANLAQVRMCWFAFLYVLPQYYYRLLNYGDFLM